MAFILFSLFIDWALINKQLKQGLLCFDLYDWNGGEKNDLIGSVVLPIGTLVRNTVARVNEVLLSIDRNLVRISENKIGGFYGKLRLYSH